MGSGSPEAARSCCSRPGPCARSRGGRGPGWRSRPGEENDGNARAAQTHSLPPARPVTGHEVRGGCWLMPNVRAEATREAGRLWPAADNELASTRLPAKGGLPRGVASRARG